MTVSLTIAALIFLLPAIAFSEQTFSVPIKPKAEQPGSGAFRLDSRPALILTTGARKPALADAVSRLAKALRCGSPAPTTGGAIPSGPYALVGLSREHPELAKLKAEQKSKLPRAGLGEEGYLLAIGPERILVAADKPAGLFHGIGRLLELAGSARNDSLQGATIADWPTMRRRGMHCLVTSRESVPQIERLITELLPGLRMNELILEINYSFAYRSHPEVASPGGLTREDCRRLREAADRSFVMIVPMFNCLGHQSWAKETFPLLTAHPEFDETPDAPKDNKGLYCRSWCPSNPDVNSLVFDLVDELIDAFQADSFHVGMDEVFLIGKCARCREKSNADLFAGAVNALHAHLRGKRKVRMMMWADRLLDDARMKYGEWESSRNGTAAAIEKIPRDIVMCDWHYETPDDFPSVKYLQEQGFQVWPSGWNREENVRRLARCALANSGPKMIGYLATTWTGPDAIVRQLTKGAEPAPYDPKGRDLPAAIRLGARAAWEGAPGVRVPTH